MYLYNIYIWACYESQLRFRRGRVRLLLLVCSIYRPAMKASFFFAVDVSASAVQSGTRLLLLTCSLFRRGRVGKRGAIR